MLDQPTAEQHEVAGRPDDLPERPTGADNEGRGSMSRRACRRAARGRVMSGRRLKVVVAGVAVAVVACAPACSKDEPAPSAGTTTTPSAVGTTADPGLNDPLAEARTVAFSYFQAKAGNDYDEALRLSTGGAARAIRWARGVNGVVVTAGPSYAMPKLSVNARVQLESLDVDGDRRRAQGFVELGADPSSVASSTTTTAPEQAPPPTTLVTDLVFRRSGGSLVVDDFRFDDSPYPVSALFLDLAPAQEVVGSAGTLPGSRPGGSQPAASTTTGTAPSAAADPPMLYRPTDGPVQYLVPVSADLATGDPLEARFSPVGEAARRVTAVGRSDRAGEIAGMTWVLVVDLGAFPGTPGTLAVLRVTTAAEPNPTDVLATVEITDLSLPGPVETGTVRRGLTASTTTSTPGSSTTASTTSTTASPSTTTSSAPTSLPTTSVTSNPTSSSSSTSSTSTTRPGTTSTSSR